MNRLNVNKQSIENSLINPENFMKYIIYITLNSFSSVNDYLCVILPFLLFIDQ